MLLLLVRSCLVASSASGGKGHTRGGCVLGPVGLRAMMIINDALEREVALVGSSGASYATIAWSCLFVLAYGVERLIVGFEVGELGRCFAREAAEVPDAGVEEVEVVTRVLVHCPDLQHRQSHRKNSNTILGKLVFRFFIYFKD